MLNNKHVLYITRITIDSIEISKYIKYSQLCELDGKLRKLFPKIPLPHLENKWL
jgi:hypothetical protein